MGLLLRRLLPRQFGRSPSVIQRAEEVEKTHLMLPIGAADEIGEKAAAMLVVGQQVAGQVAHGRKMTGPALMPRAATTVATAAVQAGVAGVLAAGDSSVSRSYDLQCCSHTAKK